MFYFILGFFSFSLKKTYFFLFHLITAKKLLPEYFLWYFYVQKALKGIESNAFVLILFTFHLSNKCLNFCGILFHLTIRSSESNIYSPFGCMRAYPRDSMW